MTDLKLLMTTYSSAFLTSGGGESEMVQLADLLKQSGCKADLYGVGSRPLSYYDAVMHFSVAQDGECILKAAGAAGKKIFLWPNVWWQSPPDEDEVKRVRTFITNATCLLFKSEAERNHFILNIGEVAIRNYVVPPGISDIFLQVPDTALLHTICELKNYVLCIGLIEATKNQLELIRALNILGVSGLFVGGFREPDYNELCTNEANSNIKFLPFLQPRSALLRSAIANAAVVAEPSFDPPGRSCIEAAMMRKPLVLIDSPWAREHFEDGPHYAVAGDAAHLCGAINAAYRDKESATRIEHTYRRALNKHSASNGIQALLNVLIPELF